MASPTLADALPAAVPTPPPNDLHIRRRRTVMTDADMRVCVTDLPIWQFKNQNPLPEFTPTEADAAAFRDASKAYESELVEWYHKHMGGLLKNAPVKQYDHEVWDMVYKGVLKGTVRNIPPPPFPSCVEGVRIEYSPPPQGLVFTPPPPPAPVVAPASAEGGQVSEGENQQQRPRPQPDWERLGLEDQFLLIFPGHEVRVFDKNEPKLSAQLKAAVGDSDARALARQVIHLGRSSRHRAPPAGMNWKNFLMSAFNNSSQDADAGTVDLMGNETAWDKLKPWLDWYDEIISIPPFPYYFHVVEQQPPTQEQEAAAAQEDAASDTTNVNKPPQCGPTCSCGCYETVGSKYHLAIREFFSYFGELIPVALGTITRILERVLEHPAPYTHVPTINSDRAKVTELLVEAIAALKVANFRFANPDAVRAQIAEAERKRQQQSQGRPFQPCCLCCIALPSNYPILELDSGSGWAGSEHAGEAESEHAGEEAESEYGEDEDGVTGAEEGGVAPRE